MFTHQIHIKIYIYPHEVVNRVSKSAGVESDDAIFCVEECGYVALPPRIQCSNLFKGTCMDV